MRGAPFPDRYPCFCARIIPADAGSTSRPARRSQSDQDHPRRCGEHSTGSWDWGRPLGSSPQMRGARRCHAYGEQSKGIIPADAGSTQYHPHSRPKCADHPRRCGEHCETDSVSLDCEGSSPQMRGALEVTVFAVTQQRIIPADAGSTYIDRNGVVHTKDHPRRCGEH